MVRGGASRIKWQLCQREHKIKHVIKKRAVDLALKEKIGLEKKKLSCKKH